MKTGTVLAVGGGVLAAGGLFYLYRQHAQKQAAIAAVEAVRRAQPPPPAPVKKGGISLSDFDPSTKNSKFGSIVNRGLSILTGGIFSF